MRLDVLPTPLPPRPAHAPAAQPPAPAHPVKPEAPVGAPAVVPEPAAGNPGAPAVVPAPAVPPASANPAAPATPAVPAKDGKDSTNPNDRSTAFEAVEGGEQHSGAVLLVEAYAAIWVFLLGFVFLQWVKQAKLHARLDDLERVIDRAADTLEKSSLQGKVAANANAGRASASVDGAPLLGGTDSARPEEA